VTSKDDSWSLAQDACTVKDPVKEKHLSRTDTDFCSFLIPFMSDDLLANLRDGLRMNVCRSSVITVTS